MTNGKQLNSRSKPEDYGYKSCPKCWWQGKKNQQHFVHFHDELHPQDNSATKKGRQKKTGKSAKKKEATGGGNKQIHATMKQILKAVKSTTGAGEPPTTNANSATTVAAAPATTPA